MAREVQEVEEKARGAILNQFVGTQKALHKYNIAGMVLLDAGTFIESDSETFNTRGPFSR